MGSPLATMAKACRCSPKPFYAGVVMVKGFAPPCWVVAALQAPFPALQLPHLQQSCLFITFALLNVLYWRQARLLSINIWRRSSMDRIEVS
jgi:hypothetical protein